MMIASKILNLTLVDDDEARRGLIKWANSLAALFPHLDTQADSRLQKREIALTTESSKYHMKLL